MAIGIIHSVAWNKAGLLENVQFDDDPLFVKLNPVTHTHSHSKSLVQTCKTRMQAQKKNLRQRLREISSFSLIPFGFQKNKGTIVGLCEEIMNVVRSGKITARDTATKFVRFSKLLNLPQI